MPVTYTIDVDTRRVDTCCVGHVTLQEVIDHFRTLEQDPQCPAHLDVFLDLSGVDLTSIPTAPQVSRVAQEVRRIQGRVQFGACAILAPRDAVFGMMRMFEMMSEDNFRVTHSFRDRASAEEWLASQQAFSGSGKGKTRRSTRVPLKVDIRVGGGSEDRTCEGETIIVNLHGALIAAALWLGAGMKISIHVYLTDKRTHARVVYVDPAKPQHCGIELDRPQNIWGVPLPPDDWDEASP